VISSVDAKRAQLRRRGWSDARIEQYLRDWKWKINPPLETRGNKRKPRAAGNGSLPHGR
jgi:hypothetical protein